MTPNRNVAWIDSETTALEVHEETVLLLEVGLVVTDNDLRELGRASVVISYSERALERFATWHSVARDIHERNGLLSEIRAGHGLPLEQAEELLIAALTRALGTTEEAMLADRALLPFWGGCSCGFDRTILRRTMPRLFDLIHHRPIDSSTLLQAIRFWTPETCERLEKPHRALPDALGAVAMARQAKGLIEAGWAATKPQPVMAGA